MIFNSLINYIYKVEKSNSNNHLRIEMRVHNPKTEGQEHHANFKGVEPDELVLSIN